MCLSEEITTELQRHGVEVVCKRLPLSYGGEADMLDAKGCNGHSVRILPIEIECSSEEEAARQSMAMAEILGRGNVIAVVRDRWERQREITLKRLLAHCGIFTSIFARNCEIRRIEKPVAQAFMTENHSYGHAACRYCYGLYVSRYSGDEMRCAFHEYPVGILIAVAEFSNARRWQKDGREVRSYEWIRYASLPEVRVVGGMGKILQQFIDDVAPDDIMSYADLEWSDGNVYRALGFVEDGVKTPVMFRVNPDTWERIPVEHTKTPTSFRANGVSVGISEIAQPLYYQNFGSVKYRLNLAGWHTNVR